MSKLCSFCYEPCTLKNLSNVSNSQSNVSLKLKDAFQLEIDTNKFTEICKECEEKLEISYGFFKQVSEIGKMHLNYNVKEEPVDDFPDTEVEISMEEGNKALYEFADPEACGFDNPSQEFSSVLIKEEFAGSREHLVNRTFVPPYRFPPSEENLEEFKFSSLFDPSKSLPFARRTDRRSKGTRKKTILCITMPHVFGEEINQQKFFQPPDMLENFDENPRLWSDYTWKCTECEQTFDNVIEMNTHLTRSHRGKRHKGTCVHCHKETPNFGSYLNHIIEEHHKNLKFCCIVCSEYESSLLDLYNHHQTAHKPIRILFCLYCGQNFSFGAYLRDHMIKVHNRIDDIKLLECDICGRTAKLKGVLIAHILRHKSRTVPCELCLKLFRNKHELKTHQQNRHGKDNKSIICSDCGKKFPNAATFNRHHKEKHLELKPFECEVCKKKFFNRTYLKNHAVMHNEVGSLPCPHCDKKFKRKTSLEYHICRDHTGQKPYCCPVAGCEYRAIDFANTRKHIKSVHKSNARPVKVSVVNLKMLK